MGLVIKSDPQQLALQVDGAIQEVEKRTVPSSKTSLSLAGVTSFFGNLWNERCKTKALDRLEAAVEKIQNPDADPAMQKVKQQGLQCLALNGRDQVHRIQKAVRTIDAINLTLDSAKTFFRIPLLGMVFFVLGGWAYSLWHNHQKTKTLNQLEKTIKQLELSADETLPKIRQIGLKCLVQNHIVIALDFIVDQCEKSLAEIFSDKWEFQAFQTEIFPWYAGIARNFIQCKEDYQFFKSLPNEQRKRIKYQHLLTSEEYGAGGKVVKEATTLEVKLSIEPEKVIALVNLLEGVDRLIRVTQKGLKDPSSKTDDLLLEMMERKLPVDFDLSKSASPASLVSAAFVVFLNKHNIFKLFTDYQTQPHVYDLVETIFRVARRMPDGWTIDVVLENIPKILKEIAPLIDTGPKALTVIENSRKWEQQLEKRAAEDFLQSYLGLAKESLSSLAI